MRSNLLISTGVAIVAGLVIAAMGPTSARAEIDLLAIGELDGGGPNADADLSGLPQTLENGIPANRFAGAGSGLAYAGGATFLALPDRGPNATPYNEAVDNTSSYIPRFHTVVMTLQPAAAGAPLPMVVTPRLEATTLLFSATPLAYGDGVAAHLGPGAPPRNAGGQFYFSGRSDNFAAGSSSLSASNARFDPEAIRVSNDGRSVFISDEYGPSVYQFDRRTGRRLKAFALPAKFGVAHLSPSGAAEIAGNDAGRTANKGMESLAITPDGKMLVGIMQAALRQDASNAASKKLLRMVTIAIADGRVREFGYRLTDGGGVSDVVAINDHEFLVLERDGAGLGANSEAVTKKLFRIDLSGALEIGDLTGEAAAAAAVRKTEVLDLVKVLGAHGVAPSRIPEKLEGLAFGPDVEVKGKTLHTLYLVNDNDFVPDSSGPNLVYVFGFDDEAVPLLTPQTFSR